MTDMEFEWDLSKEVENLRKHGITFSEAVESFLDPDGFQLIDTNTFDSRKTLLLGGETLHGTSTHHAVYETRRQDSHYRIGQLAEVSEGI